MWPLLAIYNRGTVTGHHIVLSPYSLSNQFSITSFQVILHKSDGRSALWSEPTSDWLRVSIDGHQAQTVEVPFVTGLQNPQLQGYADGNFAT